LRVTEAPLTGKAEGLVRLESRSRAPASRYGLIDLRHGGDPCRSSGVGLPTKTLLAGSLDMALRTGRRLGRSPSERGYRWLEFEASWEETGGVGQGKRFISQGRNGPRVGRLFRPAAHPALISDPPSSYCRCPGVQDFV